MALPFETEPQSRLSESQSRSRVNDFDHVHNGVAAGGFVFTSTKSKVFIEEVKEWSDLRHRLGNLLQTKQVEAFLGIVVVTSLALVVAEADTLKNPPVWLPIADWIILVVFAFEVCLRVYIYRAKFFCSALNILDLVLVITDGTGKVLEAAAAGSLPSVVVLRMFRSLRFTRTLKIMVKFPKLALLVKGLINAVSAVMYGVSLLGVFLLFWAVMAVHFIQPVNERVAAQGAYNNCQRCDRAFATVFQSMLTFSQQILAGDSWGQVTIPIIDEEPMTALFFAMVFVSIHIALLNVILAVIVDTALETSKEDAQHIVKQKQAQFAAAASRLERICAEMDLDDSGDLTKRELHDGYTNNPEFRELLEAMDVSEEDLDLLFVILDTDGDDRVDYEEFVGELHKMKAYDNHTLLIFIKQYVTEIRSTVRARSGTKGRRGSTGSRRRESSLECASLDDALLEVKDTDKPLAAVPPPADIKFEEKKKDPDPPVVLAPAAPARGLLEDIGSLRTVICEEVACIMNEISQKSEGYARLLASMAEDTSALRAGEASTSPSLRWPDASLVSSSTSKGRRRASMPVGNLSTRTPAQDTVGADRDMEGIGADKSQPRSLGSREKSSQEQRPAPESVGAPSANGGCSLGSSFPGSQGSAVGAVGGAGSAAAVGSGAEAGAAQVPALDTTAPSSAWRAQKSRGGRRNLLVPDALAELERTGGPSLG